MVSPDIKRTAITLLAAMSLLVQSALALPMPCHCAKTTSPKDANACCHPKSGAISKSCCQARRPCGATKMAACVAPLSDGDGTNCRCGCSNRDQQPLAPPQVVEAGKDWLVPFTVRYLIVSDANDIAPSHVSFLQSAHALGDASRCAQILFCIWRI